MRRCWVFFSSILIIQIRASLLLLRSWLTQPNVLFPVFLSFEDEGHIFQSFYCTASWLFSSTHWQEWTLRNISLEANFEVGLLALEGKYQSWFSWQPKSIKFHKGSHIGVSSSLCDVCWFLWAYRKVERLLIASSV